MSAPGARQVLRPLTRELLLLLCPSHQSGLVHKWNQMKRIKQKQIISQKKKKKRIYNDMHKAEIATGIICISFKIWLS